MRVFKLTGAGNHFLLIDLRDRRSKRVFAQYCKKQHFSSVGLRARIARELCNPYRSLGADGLIFLEDSRRSNYKWDFYNADGSAAEMCGNAARCVGAYLYFCAVKFSNPVSVETSAGEILITVLPGVSRSGEIYACVEMPKITVETISRKQRATVKHGQRNLNFDVINSGVPHAVFDVSNIRFSLEKNFSSRLKSKLSNTSAKQGKPRNKLSTLLKNVNNLGEIVSKVRKLTEFKRAGVNVTFYIRRGSKTIESLTFERGVVGYTQACGTGALAAAYGFSEGKHGFITVKVPGGKLGVDLSGARPLLIGPAKIIAEINLV